MLRAKLFAAIASIKIAVDCWWENAPALVIIFAWLLGSGIYLLTLSTVLPLLIAVCFIIIGSSGRKVALVIFSALAISNYKVKQSEIFATKKFTPMREEATFIVKSFDIIPPEYRMKYNLKIDVQELTTGEKYRLELRSYEFEIGHGDLIKVQGEFLEFNTLQMEGGINLGQLMAERGYSGKFKVQKVLLVERCGSWFTIFENIRANILLRLSKGFTRQSRHWRWFLAMAVGNKSFLEYDETKALIESGMFHLFAISGLHVAIISTLIVLLLRQLSWPWQISYILSPVILFFYIAVAGFSASAIRAWIMITLYYIGKCLLRQMNLYNCLAVAAIIQLSINPLLLKSSGFQMSFITVFFLVYLFTNRDELM
ncbi:MAG: ComEC/Rec2 family competence protein, partial [Lentisphaeria bacterium]